MIDEIRRATLIEALEMGAGVFLAADAAAVTIQEWNLLSNDPVEGPAWRERAVAAQTKGRIYRERVEKMRKIVDVHDEVWKNLEARAVRFQETKRQQVSGVQMPLLP